MTPDSPDQANPSEPATPISPTGPTNFSSPAAPSDPGMPASPVQPTAFTPEAPQPQPSAGMVTPSPMPSAEAAAPVVVMGGEDPAISTAQNGPAVQFSGQPTAPNPMGMPAAPGKPPRKLKLKTMLIALLVIVVLAGGSAAAYVGIIVPNQPKNVLKSAIVNALEAKQTGFSGNVQINSGIAAKVAFNGAINSSEKAVDLSVNLSVSGVSVPAEVRLVGGNAYLKVGDLSQLGSLVDALSPSSASDFNAISGEVSNKWFEVDSTLLNEVGLSCIINTSWSPTSSDISLLESQYSTSNFLTIKSATGATLGGKSVEEYALSINNAKFANYINGLTDLSVVKSLERCANGVASEAKNVSSSAASDAKGNTNLTVWVDKSDKQIVQVANSSTGKITSSSTITINHNPVSISAPAGAEPIIQLLTSLGSQSSASGVLSSLGQ